MLSLNNVKLQQFYLKCQKDKLIGIDTEFFRVNTYHPKLCLIQISNLSQSIIIDPICGKLEEKFLENLLFNKSIIKVFFCSKPGFRDFL
jgi:ribonuclease D